MYFFRYVPCVSWSLALKIRKASPNTTALNENGERKHISTAEIIYDSLEKIPRKRHLVVGRFFT